MWLQIQIFLFLDIYIGMSGHYKKRGYNYNVSLYTKCCFSIAGAHILQMV